MISMTKEDRGLKPYQGIQSLVFVGLSVCMYDAWVAELYVFVDVSLEEIKEHLGKQKTMQIS